MIYIYIYIWDYGDHQLRLTIAPRCVTTVPRVRLHGSPGGVFVGHRPPRDPGDPPLIYNYINRSLTSIQTVHTHTPRLRQGGARKNEMKMRMKGEWKWDDHENEMKSYLTKTRRGGTQEKKERTPTRHTWPGTGKPWKGKGKGKAEGRRTRNQTSGGGGGTKAPEPT